MSIQLWKREHSNNHWKASVRIVTQSSDQRFQSAMKYRHSLTSVLMLVWLISIPVAKCNEPSFDPWLNYRSMGLDDLKLALIQMDQHIERLRTELPRTEKLVRAGASPRLELVELAGDLQIRTAERAELLGLIKWLNYLQNIAQKDFAFQEKQYFEMFTGLLRPRVQHAQAILDLAQARHSTKLQLRERRAISAEEFERSSDELTETKIRLQFYKAQYLSAQYALEVREDKRIYDETVSQTLAQAIFDSKINLWTSMLQSIDHRLKRLKALNERGIVSDSEIEAVTDTRKTIESTLEESRKTPPEPHPAPGRLQRPKVQSI